MLKFGCGTCIMEEHPFPGAKIADSSFLDASSERSQCSKCLKSRKYYCYNCFIALPNIASRLPHVKLPIHVDIIKHPSEIDGKSTSPHAAVLAPDEVTIHTYPCIPHYDSDKVLLIFPCAESLTLAQIASTAKEKSNRVKSAQECSDRSAVDTDKTQCSEVVSSDSVTVPHESTNKQQCFGDQNENLSVSNSFSGEDTGKTLKVSDPGIKFSSKRPCDKVDAASGADDDDDDDDDGPSPSKRLKETPSLPFNRVVFIDSTWNQTRNIVHDERLKSLPKVELHSRNTHFWRWQEGTPKTYLSTIEAIYYFMRDVHEMFISKEYNNEYDNLLFFFCHLYSKIRKTSKGGKGIKAYERNGTK
ncbi:tRNA-uridine aminocarboxypropyltransferase 1 isoform X2 [Aplysia californica]|uniref:tRNA-uridine aminocarboxypropyltransferase 1 n=1 Tax=Aplysia californica TaxID=6500 RepID=A0ABM0JAL2_APLCA|nr:tRNA-uridine aminocarboxypropyltransferase 1 isoform X2 [Aplysia californica]